MPGLGRQPPQDLGFFRIPQFFQQQSQVVGGVGARPGRSGPLRQRRGDPGIGGLLFRASAFLIVQPAVQAEQISLAPAELARGAALRGHAPRSWRSGGGFRVGPRRKLVVMDADREPSRPERETWLFGDRSGVFHGMDLAELDPGNEDERGILYQAEHPEFARAIDQEVDEVMWHGTLVSPRLHLLIHEVVANQILHDTPPEVWQTALRLEVLGYGRDDILHMLGTTVANQIFRMQAERLPYDGRQHLRELAALPQSWEAERLRTAPRRKKRRRRR